MLCCRLWKVNLRNTFNFSGRPMKEINERLHWVTEAGGTEAVLFSVQKQYQHLRWPFKIRITIQYYEYKACVLALFPTRMSFYLILMRTSHSLLSLTSPCSHPLLPPPSLSPCLTLTVIQFWHLLPEPPPTCLPNLSYPPLQLHIFVYSLYISVLLFLSLSACCVCVSSRTMWCTR